MKGLLTAVACFGLVLGGTGLARANLITNGSFEDTQNVYPGGGYVTVSSGSGVSIPGWSVVSGSVDWINSYWQASDGTKSLDLAGYYKHGLISSTPFDTTPGQKYRVSFDMAGNPDQSYSKALVSISTGEEPLTSHIFTFDQSGHTKTDMGWTTQYFDFIAASNIAQINFGDVTGELVGGNIDPSRDPNESWGAALDNVKVDPVPEPSTLLLLGAGLSGLGFLRRRRRR